VDGQIQRFCLPRRGLFLRFEVQISLWYGEGVERFGHLAAVILASNPIKPVDGPLFQYMAVRETSMSQSIPADVAK
jgi:hypothetical protein